MENFKCIWITSLLKQTNMFNIKPDFTMYKNTIYQHYLSSVMVLKASKHHGLSN